MSWQAARIIRASLNGLVLGILLVFLFVPLLIVIAASFEAEPGVAFRFPPRALGLASYRLIDNELWSSLGLSILIGVLTALVSVVLGTMTAFGIVRGKLFGQGPFIDALFRAPLQIPHVVTGVAFLQLYYLVAEWTSLNLLGTLPGILLAHVFFTTPYVIGTVGASLQRFNPRLEEAAFSLGASKASMLRRVTLPVILPGIYAGGLYAFVVSFGDVPVSLFLAGAGKSTLPVTLFYSMEYDFRPGIVAISAIVMVGSLAIIWGMQKLVGLDNISRSGS